MAATLFLDFSTQLPIRSPIHYWVYLAPLRRYPPELLPLTPLLRPSDLEYFRITVRHAFFFEIRPNFSRILTKRFRSYFLSP